MVYTQNEKLTIQSYPKMDYAVTEAMNTLWTNLSYSGTDVKSIAFTSCRPDEGKSFMVMNLARVIAGTGKTVLVVDADLRSRSLRALPHQQPQRENLGLAHYLSGQCRMNYIVYETNHPG